MFGDVYSIYLHVFLLSPGYFPMHFLDSFHDGEFSFSVKIVTVSLEIYKIILLN